jgi:glycosyltransferase involved in cell wall biosynthesis
MWKGKKVSVVFSTYREKNSIRKYINDLFKTGLVDEVVVVNNNAEKGTDEEVRKTKAKLFHEPRQGFGAGYRTALAKATGDLLIMSEPDGTFYAKDIVKLLAYSEDFDVVVGTRTNRSTILKGANMGWFLRWGNIFVAKLMQVLFNAFPLTDAGCTLRLIRRSAYEKIKGQFTIYSLEFNPELTLLYILNRLKTVEIPIHYGERVGESAVTGSFLKSFKLGFIMMRLIFAYRIKSLGGWPPRKK